MPVVKKTVEGVEYGFAPLKLKELRSLRYMKERQDGFERLDEWKPLIESSMQRAGSSMPDVEDMDIYTASRVFGDLIRGVMEASGMAVTVQGEAVPAVANASIGANSTASLSPLPDGESAK